MASGKVNHLTITFYETILKLTLRFLNNPAIASGLGINGTVGRCFYHFQDFAVCMKKEDDPVNNCVGLRDDYIECLHGFKQVIIGISCY